MNSDSDRSWRARAPAHVPAYGSADELLDDLGADAGTEARALATGYWMAIHDSDSGCLSASELLKYLQAETGSVPELMGLGYVQAIHDCTQADGRVRVPGGTPEQAGLARLEAMRVRTWLESRPHGVMQPALTAVQLALGEPVAAVVRGAPAPVRAAGVVGWVSAQSVVAKGMTAVAAALAMVVAAQHVASAHDAERSAARDLAVGRQAQYMTAMLLEQRRYEKDSIINMDDPMESEAYARLWDKARVAMQGSIDSLGSADLPVEDRQSLSAIRADFRTYEQGYLNLLAQIRDGQVRTPQDANRVLENYKPAAHRAEANGILMSTRALQRQHLR